MKSFKLIKVSYKNIMSVGAKPITIQLDSHKRTLISGKNGASKSTIMEAITFALFGKSFRDIKKGQLINSVNKKDLVTELWLEYDNSSYYIKRGQKPNIFEITKDGVELSEAASSKDFQEELEKMIGINYNAFKQVVVLGTAGYVPFMSLTTPVRRRFVEDLLGVSVLAIMDKLNKTEIRDINQQIGILGERLDSVNNQINIYKDNQDRQSKLSGDQLARLELMKEEETKEAKRMKAELDKLNEDMLAIELPENPGSTSELISEVSKIDAYITSLNKVKSMYAKGGSCPTCMQNISVNDAPMISKISLNITDYETQKKLLEESLLSLKADIASYETAVKEISVIRQKIIALKPSIVASVNKVKKIISAIEKCKEEAIDYSSEIEELIKNRDIISENKSDILLEKYDRSTVTELLKDSGIKGSIVSEYIPLFNREINKYLKMMDADYVFTLDSEFNETIKSRGRETFTYNSFSQGEKARIDIALLFTWRYIAEKISGINLSCLILDEVTDGSTDEEGIKAIQQILKGLGDTNIFIISHRGHNPDDYDRHIEMSKLGRFSVMKETINDA